MKILHFKNHLKCGTSLRYTLNYKRHIGSLHKKSKWTF